jgi:coenzyme F420 hydrogenase subunit beta
MGCGTCAYACPSKAIGLRNFVEHGVLPVVDHERCDGCQICLQVCPGHELTHDRKNWPAGTLAELANAWGPVLEVWEGWAGDPEIRFRGGSGGAATALALWSLVDGQAESVLHVGMDPERPWLNRLEQSRTRTELIERTGSRYAPSPVGAGFAAIEQARGQVTLIGKPCDIEAAQKARRVRPQLDAHLGLRIAIFCGGVPSTRGTLEILRQLGVDDPQQAQDFRYRGYGWPGMTGLSLRSDPTGKRLEMTYQRAWDTILTKHKPFRCHVCPDGTGEFADLACGDPWYRPIEPGEAGSSLILVRTEAGRAALQRAIATGFIVAEQRPADLLPKSQRGLFLRRAAILPKQRAARFLRLSFPRFTGFDLAGCWNRIPLRRKLVAQWRGFRWMWGLRRRGPLRLGNEERQRAEPVMDAERLRSLAPSDLLRDR